MPADADAQLVAQAGSLSQGLLAEAGGGTLRSFTFSVDIQHFIAGSRLPLNLAAVALELELPAELAGLIQQSNGRVPPRLAPLRTQAVQVARGSEAALPGGRASCDFAAGLMSVASLLARNPVMTIDVYHRERLADDLLLGRAHVPLAPLLQESWVDGRAGVFALVPLAADPAQHERVQIGTVHLVMSLEEAGPATVAGPTMAAVTAAALPGAAEHAVHSGALAAGPNSSGSDAGAVQSGGSLGAAVGVPGAAHAAAHAAEEEKQQQQQAVQVIPALGALAAAEPLPQAQPARPQSASSIPQAADVRPAAAAVATTLGISLPAAAPAMAVAAGAAAPAPDCFAGPEFEAAWQVELWKREEEAKWRRDLQEREGRRMAALEEAWRRREAEREGEATTLRSEYSALESKARQILAAAEEREQRVVAAEEAVARRRRELEREHAGRVAEAEAAVRRLQAECQHQLELEQHRREALAQQKAAAETKAAAAEARAAAAERALQQHREQHSRSEAGRVEAELAGLRQELAGAEQRAGRAAEAKRKYKEQVVRLAQEVALLQQQLAELAGVKRRQLDAELAKLEAQEQALAARRDAVELGALKQQLHSLQLGGGGSSVGSHRADVACGVAAAGGPGGGCEKENGGASLCRQGGAAAVQEERVPRQQSGPVVLRGQLCEAVERLMAERELLLGSGAYAAEDPLIAQLDKRIRECAALAQQAPAGGR